MNRREERKHAFCLIFQISFYNDLCEEDLIEILQLYKESCEVTSSSKNEEFLLSYFGGVLKNINEIDETINKSLTGWTLSRLNKVDISLLRLAIYEMKFTNTPNKVVINEVIEIAKQFSSDDSPRFINGLLASIASDGETI